MKNKLLSAITITLLMAFALTGCMESNYYRQNNHHSQGYYQRRHTNPPPGVTFEIRK